MGRNATPGTWAGAASAGRNATPTFCADTTLLAVELASPRDDPAARTRPVGRNATPDAVSAGRNAIPTPSSTAFFFLLDKRLCFAYRFFSHTGQVRFSTNSCNCNTAAASSRWTGSSASRRKGRCSRKHIRAIPPAGQGSIQ